MLDRFMPFCNVDGCTKTASFGYTGGTRIRCATHREPEMVGFTKKYCEFPGCTGPRVYNTEGRGTRLFCELHKLPGMVRCGRVCHGSETCAVSASFNYPGDRRPVACKTHATPGMINLYNRICLTPSCKKTSSYGFETREYCRQHKMPGMTSLSGSRAQKAPPSSPPAEELRRSKRIKRLAALDVESDADD